MPYVDDLHLAIERLSQEIKTDGYSMSIGEFISLYRDSDIDVHPEFQRIFRWKPDQKARLIESILLGIPVPTIFVAQRDNGVWDVIDGVQRLSTILEFVGIYKNEEGDLQPPLRLVATEYLPNLDGFTYEVGGPESRVFDDILRRDFKRSKLDFRIIKKESDEQAKYDLFQRLNSGTQLSPQEVRNCVMVMIDSNFYQWVDELSETPQFNSTVLLSERKEEEAFANELVLRFFMQLDLISAGSQELPSELGKYITDWMRQTAAPDFKHREAEWSKSFSQTFGLLQDATEDNTFRRYDHTKGRFLGPFSISAFEAISSGVGAHVDAWSGRSTDELRDRIVALWADKTFKATAGSTTPRRRTPRLVHLGRDFFA